MCKRNEQGFSLIELLIGLLISGLTARLQTQVQAAQAREAARRAEGSKPANRWWER